MEQISPPMRIALAAVLAFAALWFVALRPKPVAEVATEPTPVQPATKTAITGRPAQAKDAVNKLNATSAKREAAAGSTAAPAKAKPAQPAKADATPTPKAKAVAKTEAAAPAKAKAAAPAKAAPAKAKAPAAPKAAKGAEAVIADVKAGRTVVLLFWDGKSSEDQAVRRAVQRVDRRGGKVRVHVANLKQISRYGAITSGVPVTSSPTVVVIGKGGKAQIIRGLTVTGEIDDTVSKFAGK